MLFSYILIVEYDHEPVVTTLEKIVLVVAGECMCKEYVSVSICYHILVSRSRRGILLLTRRSVCRLVPLLLFNL